MRGIVTQNVLGTSGLIKSPDVGGGAWNFISKQTASSSATIDFTSGIDSTYKEYLFTFKNIHPATDSQTFGFQADTGTNTSYNQTITSTWVYIQHGEDAGSAGAGYSTSYDQAQGTAFQAITSTQGNGNDESASGTLYIFDPSNATFAKQFLSDTQQYYDGDDSIRVLAGGYITTTTALTRFQFKMSSGDIDAGDICLYGLTT